MSQKVEYKNVPITRKDESTDEDGNPIRTTPEGRVVRKLFERAVADHQEYKSEIAAIRDSVEALERKDNKRRMSGGDYSAAPQPSDAKWIDVKTGKPLVTLNHSQKMAALPQYQVAGVDESKLSPGRWLRGVILGGNAPDAAELAEERAAFSGKSLAGNVDPAGGLLMPTEIAARFIDALRAKLILSAAGCTTLPMPTRALTFAKITADPTAYWHGENAADFSATDPTFGAVELHSRTVVAMTKFSLELSQDAPNLEAILTNSLTQALAHAIDSAALSGKATGSAAAPTGILNNASRNTVTSVGTPTNWDFLANAIYELMLDNVAREDIGALVAHPALLKKMSKLKTGIASDNTSLPLPAYAAGIPQLYSTAAPLAAGTGTAILADWRDVVWGVRSEITVQAIPQAFMGSTLSLCLLAFARCDVNLVRPESLCSIEGITGL